MFKKNHHSPIFKHLPLTPKRSHFHFHLEFIPSQPTQQPTTSPKNTKTLEGYKHLIDVKRLLCIAHLPSAPYVVLAAAPSLPPTSTAPHAIAPSVAPFPPTAWRPSPTSGGWEKRHLSETERLQAKDESEKSWHSMFDLLVLDCYLKSSKETQVLSCSKHEHQGLEICNTTHLYIVFLQYFSFTSHLPSHPSLGLPQPFLHLPFLFFTTLPVLTDGFGHILLHGSSVATLEVLHCTKQFTVKDYREFEGIIWCYLTL